MNHSFNVEVAKEVGVLAAAIFNSIGFWVDHNRANGAEQHDGRHWTYNTVKAWAEQFPYASAGQIDYALGKLKASGYIVTGRYNRSPYDRTLWYSLSDKGERIFYGIQDQETRGSISKNSEMEQPDLQESITDTKQDSLQDKVPYQEVIDALNKATGKHYKAVEPTKKLIRARWCDGYRLEDFEHVVKVKAAEWKGTDMEKYLRPQTLFAPSKFEAYVNQQEQRRSSDAVAGYDY